MVDKKLSSFSQITPAEISKLICLFLDQNNAIKNGVVDFATLDALLAHKAGTETFTGNKTFSGDTVFSGNATFNIAINASITGNAGTVTNGVYTTGNQTIGGNKTFSGTTKAPTPSSTTDNSTNVATTAFVKKVLTAVYPVGSIYIGTQSTCPLATLISGSTWTKIEGRYLLASGTLNGTSETYSATNTVAAGLPNITGKVGYTTGEDLQEGAFYKQTQGRSGTWDTYWSDRGNVLFDSSRSNSMYNSSATVRPTAYVVNVWRRTA